VSGSIVWKRKNQGGGASDPSVVAGIVYVGTLDTHALFAYDAATGRTLWVFPGGGPVSSAAVTHGILFDVTGYPGTVFALDAATGAELWSTPTGGSVSGPALARGKVYVGSDDHKVYAFRQDDGTLVWSVTTHLPVISSPVVVGRTVYVGSEDGRLDALDADTGAHRSVFKSGRSDERHCCRCGWCGLRHVGR
jgi:glucose dehydrogenase